MVITNSSNMENISIFKQRLYAEQKLRHRLRVGHGVLSPIMIVRVYLPQFLCKNVPLAQ